MRSHRPARLWVSFRAALAASLALASAVVGAPASAAPEDALRRQLERYVEERAPVPPTSIEIPSLTDFAIAWEAPGEVRVVFTTAPQRFLGSVPVTITVYVEGEAVKRGVVTTRVRAEQTIYLTARALERGALVHRQDLREERRDVSNIPTGALADPGEIVGKRTTRALPSGSVWLPSHLRTPQIVTRGQVVRLNFRSGALAIEGLGKARQDGRPGERIRVINVDTRREVVGIVTPAGEVDVAL